MEYCKLYDFYLPPACLTAGVKTVKDLWCASGRPEGLVAGTAVQLGTRPKQITSWHWQGGDSMKGRRSKSECLPVVLKAMKACLKETASVSRPKMDPKQVSRATYVQSQHAPVPESRKSDPALVGTAATSSETVPAGKDENAELLQPSLLLSKPGNCNLFELLFD